MGCSTAYFVLVRINENHTDTQSDVCCIPNRNPRELGTFTGKSHDTHNRTDSDTDLDTTFSPECESLGMSAAEVANAAPLMAKPCAVPGLTAIWPRAPIPCMLSRLGPCAENPCAVTGLAARGGCDPRSRVNNSVSVDGRVCAGSAGDERTCAKCAPRAKLPCLGWRLGKNPSYLAPLGFAT